MLPEGGSTFNITTIPPPESRSRKRSSNCPKLAKRVTFTLLSCLHQKSPQKVLYLCSHKTFCSGPRVPSHSSPSSSYNVPVCFGRGYLYFSPTLHHLQGPQPGKVLYASHSNFTLNSSETDLINSILFLVFLPEFYDLFLDIKFTSHINLTNTYSILEYTHATQSSKK